MNLSEIGAVCITALTGFRARELGSINDWIQSGSDPTHWAYEPMTWNYEFEQEIRIEDPGVHAIPVIQNNWHSGGWGSRNELLLQCNN